MVVVEELDVGVLELKEEVCFVLAITGKEIPVILSQAIFSYLVNRVSLS